MTNACAWAVAFHTTLALEQGLIQRKLTPFVSVVCRGQQLAALSALAKALIERRGRLDDQDVDRFISAGFGKDHALEVIAVVAASTITNYTGNVTKRLSRRRSRPTPGPPEGSRSLLASN